MVSGLLLTSSKACNAFWKRMGLESLEISFSVRIVLICTGKAATSFSFYFNPLCKKRKKC